MVTRYVRTCCVFTSFLERSIKWQASVLSRRSRQIVEACTTHPRPAAFFSSFVLAWVEIIGACSAPAQCRWLLARKWGIYLYIRDRDLGGTSLLLLLRHRRRKNKYCFSHMIWLSFCHAHLNNKNHFMFVTHWCMICVVIHLLPVKWCVYYAEIFHIERDGSMKSHRDRGGGGRGMM